MKDDELFDRSAEWPLQTTEASQTNLKPKISRSTRSVDRAGSKDAFHSTAHRHTHKDRQERWEHARERANEGERQSPANRSIEK